MSYTHLSQNERYQIHTMLDLLPVADIATRLGRHESTIRRELARNRGERGDRPRQAQMLADERSIGSRNAACISPVIWAQALELLMVQHSPEQIAGCLPISHETVYQRVYDDCTGQLKQHLRCQKKRKKRYASGANRRGQIPNRRGIEERSAAVETRNRIGHFDWGRTQRCIGDLGGTQVWDAADQKSEIQACDLVSQAFGLLTPVKQTVADHDNGKEFAMHLNAAIGWSHFLPIRIAWQRGTNENTNGLIRSTGQILRHLNRQGGSIDPRQTKPQTA